MVLVQVIKDLINIVLAQLDPQAFDSFGKLRPRDPSVLIHIKEEESLRDRRELLLHFDSDKGNDLRQMHSLILFSEILEYLLFVLRSSSLVRIQYEVDVLTLVLVSLDLQWQELVHVNQVMQFLATDQLLRFVC